jgi:hypothetical protein
MTTKGELVRAILFPPPHDFKFFSDFLKSVYVFLVLGLIGMAYSLTMWIRNGVSGGGGGEETNECRAGLWRGCRPSCKEIALD